MRQFIVLLIVLLAAIFLGIKAAEDPGLAYFSYQSWSIQMPLWVAIAILLFAFFVFYGLMQLTHHIDLLGYRLSHWWSLQKKYKSYSKTNRGLLELIEGNFLSAEADLIAGIKQSETPLINYLAAAKAAHSVLAYERRDRYLRYAHQIAPNADTAISVIQAKWLMEQTHYEEALAILKRIHRHNPKHKAVLKLLERAYIHFGDWDALLELLPTLRKTKTLTTADSLKLEKRIYLETLAANPHQNESSLRANWQHIPRALQHEPEMLQAYVQRLAAYPNCADYLVGLLTSLLKKNWHDGLVAQYGLLTASNVNKQLTGAEGWLKQHKQNPVLLHALGRLAVQAQLWGKARQYYENSLRLEKNVDAQAEYQRLLNKLENLSKSNLLK